MAADSASDDRGRVALAQPPPRGVRLARKKPCKNYGCRMASGPSPVSSDLQQKHFMAKCLGVANVFARCPLSGHLPATESSCRCFRATAAVGPVT